MSRTVDADQHAEKRRRILEAAIACFARKGFHSTSTAEICRAAGMSPGNLFHYFATKEAIILAIAEEDRRETAMLFAAVESSSDTIGAIIQIAERALAQFSDPLHAQITIEIAAEAMRNPSIAAMFVENDVASVEALEQLLRSGVERDQIDPGLDVRSTALWLIALIEGAVGRATMDRTADPQKTLDTLRTLVSRFLRTPSAKAGV